MRILENELIPSTLRIQDEHPLFMNTSSFDPDISGLTSGSYQTSFRILSTVTPNSISLQSVQIKGQRVIKTPIQQFTVDEGKIVGFEIHPSHDYLLVTSN